MTNLTKDLKDNLTQNKDRKFLRDIRLDQWFDGSQVEADIALFQQVLRQANFGRDDVVLMSLENSAGYIPINQALWRLGITAHPVSAETSASELKSDHDQNHYQGIILTKEKVQAFSSDPNLEMVALSLQTLPEMVFFYQRDLSAGRPQVPLESTLGWILNTSGTTGKPKQVGLSHEIMYKAANYDLTSHELTPDDTVLIVMPMFHINAQELIINATLLSGGKIAIAPRFSARNFWRWIKEVDATWSSIVPTIVTILLKNEASRQTFDPDNKLRFIRCASAMLALNRHEEFVKTFKIPILEGYGMTEACSQCTLNPLDAIKRGSVGKPYHTDVKIIAPDGSYTSKPNIQGEIAIAGDHVITSYLGNNTKDFHHGWFHTGDLGYFDEDGYLWLNGRIKHVIINRGGEKVSPIIVENALAELDFIQNVAVVPTPDELYGEVVTAAVILDEKFKADHQKARTLINEHARATLPKYRRPEKIFFVDSFPLNPTRKIMREELSKQLQKIEKEG